MKTLFVLLLTVTFVNPAFAHGEDEHYGAFDNGQEAEYGSSDDSIIPGDLDPKGDVGIGQPILKPDRRKPF